MVLVVRVLFRYGFEMHHTYIDTGSTCPDVPEPFWTLSAHDIRVVKQQKDTAQHGNCNGKTILI